MQCKSVESKTSALSQYMSAFPNALRSLEHKTSLNRDTHTPYVNTSTHFKNSCNVSLEQVSAVPSDHNS